MAEISDSLEELYSTPEMSATFSAQAHVRSMLAFESALARAEARAGLIPQAIAIAIAASCNANFYPISALYREAARSGTPAIPLVRMLTEHVEGEAKKFVHLGATSQDVIDTALMLQMRDGLDLLIGTLQDICASCANLVRQHRQTLMIGRTLLQQALPITFGLKAAHWLAFATRLLQTLRERRQRSLALQFGGAAGTLASLNTQGIEISDLLAEELELPAPALPWHTERDRIAEIASALGTVAGAVAKIAGDIALLAQTEVGEVSEAPEPGKGRSSAMPHKRNPVDAINALAATRLAMGYVPTILSAMAQEHERAIGGWQSEWATIPDLFRTTACALEHLRRSLAGLQINTGRMKANLDLTRGLVMAEALTTALAPHLGREVAYARVQAACDLVMERGMDLRQAALADEQISATLSPEALEKALDPLHYLGSAEIFIERALQLYESAR
ncbi:MAG TPA: 3-carboxy-cis,cis-muconate cycloisomerase [Ktedonobacteraceae bacterium]|nr:3-carboxy-cis,cis-muconate cycloisomerase [Ktedonobacteraceae bacterium]